MWSTSDKCKQSVRKVSENGQKSKQKQEKYCGVVLRIVVVDWVGVCAGSIEDCGKI